MQECMYETNIRDIDELHKCLIQTWFDFEQNVTDAAIDIDDVTWLTSGATTSDHVCVLVMNTLNTCYEIIIRLYYMVHQHSLWNCQCNLVHLTAILCSHAFLVFQL